MKLLRRDPAQFRMINRGLYRVFLLLAASALSFVALIMPEAGQTPFIPLQPGEVAPQDFQAPTGLSYTSQTLTEQARLDAENRVAPVYLPADPGIARQQLETLRSALNYITSVRLDSYATQDQKITDLQALNSVPFTTEEAQQVLELSDARWQVIQEETLSVLEQVMRNSIREGQVRDAQRSLPTLISFTLSQDQATIVSLLVTPFVIPNSLYSEELTAIARQEAVQNVAPITRTYIAGETIVRRGQIINAAAWEALETFGLIDTPNNYRDTLGALALVSAMAGFLTLYIARRKLPIAQGLRSLTLFAIAFLVFLYFARLTIPNRTVIPYLFPIPAFGLTIACLFTIELGLVSSLVLSILVAFGLPNSLDLTIYYMIANMFGILILGKGLRVSSFFWAGMGIGAAGSAVLLAYRVPSGLTDLLGLLTLLGAAFFNGLASASLTLILQFLFSQVLGLTTALQLLEISRPDHPLQQFILQNAPGSFQHSLQVAILVEQAAESIGADPLLVRVGAIYHDAGKALNPSFFIENQVPGNLNPHDDLDPAVSAQTIIRHVHDSVLLARKYHLPNSIIDFMREHHGTLITRYQYNQALQAAGEDTSSVDLEQFRYPGPRPQSRETALLMLADGCQARARAELPNDPEQIRAIVRGVMDFCQREGQLDDTRLTLRDLTKITESFVKTLQNTYHPRIRYPEVKTVPVKRQASETEENQSIPASQSVETQ